jgi:hypothetical protein
VVSHQDREPGDHNPFDHISVRCARRRPIQPSALPSKHREESAMSSAEAASRVPPAQGRPLDTICSANPGIVAFLVKYKLVTVTD